MRKNTLLTTLNYPGVVRSEERCIVGDSDVPSGYGGINREGYTYGELRHQPIIPEVMKLIQTPQLKKFAEECNARNAQDGFQMYRINGEYCFWGLRVGPAIHAPNVEELKKQILRRNPKTALALESKTINGSMIRDITYSLLREEIGRLCGMSEREAGLAIGNQLDCVPHEDEAGVIYMVPNWAHNWFRHDGYVSKMLKELNR